MNKKIHEDIIVKIWQSHWINNENLLSNDGRRIRILNPGELNTDCGPDFQRAVIKIGEGAFEGDVEIHIKSRDWKAHKHHKDPKYNNVILHVVMWDSKEEFTPLQNDKTVPILTLCEHLKGSLEEARCLVPKEPHCDISKRIGEERVSEALDKAGENRFYLKVEEFETRLLSKEGGQVLYEGIMEALGYAKNKEAFSKLANHLPFNILRGLVWNKPLKEQIFFLQTLFLKTAGLLPPQDKEKAKEYDWHFFRVRPDNFPTHRIYAASNFVAQCLKNGMSQSILEPLIEIESRATPEELENIFIVPNANYETVPGYKRGNSGFIGRGRAREIVVNIILPFSIAWARTFMISGLEAHILAIYEHYPPLESNKIIRQMTKNLFGRNKSPQLINSAKRQQGLIHLYKTFCCHRKCNECPLGRLV